MDTERPGRGGLVQVLELLREVGSAPADALLTGLLEEIGAPNKVRLIPVLDGSGPGRLRVTPSRRARLVHRTSCTTIKEERS